MREDMNKVIVERPRVGHRRSFKEVRRDKDFNGPVPLFKESMRVRYVITWVNKTFNENLNPLWRYLGKQVGRKWDDVYSEIRKTFNHNKTINDHIMIHVRQEVCTKVIEVNGKLCDANITYGGYNELYPQQLYVDGAGVLLRYNRPKYRFTVRADRKTQMAEVKKRDFTVGNKRLFVKDGLWYICDIVKQEYTEVYYPIFDEDGNIIGETTKYREVYRQVGIDAWGGRNTTKREFRERPKRTKTHINHKQCNKTELTRYNLSNSE